MSCIVLEENNRHDLLQRMDGQTWIVACLCAAWCDVCTDYRRHFEALEATRPDILFVWIDVEDCADLIGDMEVENFPTLLIQHDDQVAFYGATLPDAHIALRLLDAYMSLEPAEFAQQQRNNRDYQKWQEGCNLRRALAS